MGRRTKSSKGKAGTKRSPARKPPKSEGARVRDLEKRLARALKREAEALRREAEAQRREAEALEQQTATSDILRVISQSPTDVDPVFRALTTSAIRLARGDYGGISLLQDDVWHLAASQGLDEGLATFQRIFPMPLERSGLMQATVTTRAPVHTRNVFEDPRVGPFALELASAAGYHAFIHVPLLRRDVVMGLLTVIKREPGPFSPNEVALLQTFADQAVLAIENVRLFKELDVRNRDLTEALDRQTATSEILQVMSQSPTDVQPVFDTIARDAVRLCGAVYATLYRVEGQLIHFVAHHNFTPEQLETWRRTFPRPVDGTGAPVQRVVRTGAVYRIGDADAQHDVDVDPAAQAGQRARGLQSLLIVPMFRLAEVIGAIGVTHVERNAFTDAHVKVLKTFADQAVIAIENVRLFKELGARNRDLTEALEQQTATAEILRVISSSPTDVQPVFDTIVPNAVSLCGARMGAVYRFDGELTHLVAHHNYPPAVLEVLQQMHPRPPQSDQASGRAILTRAVAQIEDMLADPLYPREIALAGGWRSIIGVPMLRDGTPIGAIVITRNEAGPFSDAHVELLKTFADQAVIAVENGRLFTELQEKNRALTEAHAQVSEALEQQMATSEILRVISSSPTEVQPVFDAIVRSASRLCGGEWAIVTRYDGELVHLAAQHNPRPGGADAASRLFPQVPQYATSITARAIVDRSCPRRRR